MELGIRIAIIVIGIIGMTLMATGFLKRKIRVEFFIYFTNLSNMFILAYYLLNCNNREIHYLVTLYITFTMIVFNFIIYPYLRKNNASFKDIGTDAITSTIVHIIVPILAIIYWLKFGENVSYSFIPVGYIFPMLYLIFALFLGRSSFKIRDNITNYIYPFLDLEKLGKNRVIINCFLLFIFLTLLSWLLIFIK